MLKATKRHPYRPAHIHFMIGHDGYETLVTHLFVTGDPYLDSDAVFGVKQSLIVDLKDEIGPVSIALIFDWRSRFSGIGNSAASGPGMGEPATCCSGTG